MDKNNNKGEGTNLVQESLYDAHSIICKILSSEMMVVNPLEEKKLTEYYHEYVSNLEFYDGLIQNLGTDDKDV